MTLTEEQFRRLILYMGYLLATAREEDKDEIFKFTRELIDESSLQKVRQ